MTYPQVNILRCHRLLELHLVLGHYPGIVILRILGVDRFRRMPDVVIRTSKRRVRS